MKKSKLSIIIVTRNGLEDLKICLPSILKQTFQDFEVCVVDNGSDDGSVEYVYGLGDMRIQIIQLDQNYGFAMPNNIGYKNTSGKYVLTLNNDIELTDNFLEEALNFLESSDKDVYAINPKMIYYYDREIINTVGIGILNNGNGFNIGKGDPISLHDLDGEIFGPSGGAAFYKREVIEELGGYLFDNSYFAYLEDVDLAIRARIDGYKAFYVSSCVCYHKHSNTSKRFPYKKLHLIERNRLRNLIKYYPIKLIILEPFNTFFIYFKAYFQVGKINVDKKQSKFISLNIIRIIGILFLTRLTSFFHLFGLFLRRTGKKIEL